MTMLENALRERLSVAEQQADRYAKAVDSLSQQLTEAYQRLAAYDSDYVRQHAPDLVPEPAPATAPAADQ